MWARNSPNSLFISCPFAFFYPFLFLLFSPLYLSHVFEAEPKMRFGDLSIYTEYFGNFDKMRFGGI